MSFAHVTVATVVERNGKFLFVEERDSEGQRVINQPAGHLERNETLLDAAHRETLEETCWNVELRAYLGVRQYTAPNQVTYIRHSFIAVPINELEEAKRDKDILDVLWLSEAELKMRRCRSPMVANELVRYRKNESIPLESVLAF